MISAGAALEDHIRPHLLRVTDAAGRMLGSGFAVGGSVLTCAHVAERHALEDLRVGGSPVTRRIVGACTDAALLSIDRPVGGLAVSLRRPEGVLAAGYPVERGLTGAVFSRAEIGGSADVAYRADGREHAVEGAWTLAGVLMSPGQSGGPVIDRSSGAVAGIAVANFRPIKSTAGPSGFVLPISRLLEDELLAEHIRRTLSDTPRFGIEPNGAAAAGWCRAATAAEVERMSEERLYDPDGIVVRGAFDEELRRFLLGTATIWAVVDLSGLGKSTALASNAVRMSDRPTMFLRAMEIEDTSGLNAMVARKLASVAPPYVVECPTLAALAAAGGSAPLVIVDGLNEAALDAAQVRDRWLPDAAREARGCKLVLSCRPEYWQQIADRLPRNSLHTAADDGGRVGGGFRIGEFSDDEWREFVSRRFEDGPGLVRRLRNPLLLELAAELQDGPEVRMGRWDLLERWISRDCGRAVDGVSSLTPRMAEHTLESLAAACLATGERTIARLDPLARDPAFDPLLRQHLLVREGERYAFRYDVLFEHLAARSLRADALKLHDGLWRHRGYEVDWAIVTSFSQRLARMHDVAGVELVWSQIDAQAELPAWRIARLLAVLPIPPERETAALRIFERSAAGGMWGFTLIDSDLADADWPHGFASAVLHLAVRSASGYDFRENDLFEAMRFHRDRGQFEIQGFRRYVANMLSLDRRSTLDVLASWHEDVERLGTIWGDATKESTVSSWTSCCFVFCSDLLSDEELLSVPSARRAYAVFAGLARLEPKRLPRLAETLAGRGDAEPARLRAVIAALDGASDDCAGMQADEYQALACRLAIDRFDDLGSDDFRNQVIGWCARRPERQDEAWDRLVELAEAGRAESGALQAFLPHRPDVSVALARRIPHGFFTHSGRILLDLARSRFAPDEALSDKIASIRADLLREYVSTNGLDKEACRALEDLVYAMSIEQAESLGIVELALEAIRVGPDPSPLVYFAGDQNRTKSADQLGNADRFAHAFAAHANEELAGSVLNMRLMRARDGISEPELSMIGDIASIVAQRFGPGAVVRAFEDASIFLERLEARSRAAVGEAVLAKISCADLDDVIKDLTES